jgi:uncharacterized protein
MANQWISPNTITGDAATGSRYFRREHINDYFWREVKKGNHILFVAPRRVGKTSIMKDLVDNCADGYFCIYQNIEGVKTRGEFYKRLFELILQCANKATQAKTVVGNWLKKYGIEEITKSGVKFKKSDIDYEKELRSLIPELKSAKINTVIFLDEFAEVINKLNKKNEQQDATDILHTLREIRSDDNFNHFTLVFAGSIGLEFIIKSIDRPKLINDLHPVETGALTPAEASKLITQLTKGATIQLSPSAIEYLKQKTNHLLPYYLQLMLEESDLVAREADNPAITNTVIDEAFERVLRKNKNFEDWLIRLKDYHGDAFAFINEILVHTAHKDKITVQEIYDKAIDKRFKRPHDYMDFVEQLIHDGYLVETEKHVYRFISPFLQQFWLNKFPIYNG